MGDTPFDPADHPRSGSGRFAAKPRPPRGDPGALRTATAAGPQGRWDGTTIRVAAAAEVLHNPRSRRPLQDRTVYTCVGPDGTRFQNTVRRDLERLLRERYPGATVDMPPPAHTRPRGPSAEQGPSAGDANAAWGAYHQAAQRCADVTAARLTEIARRAAGRLPDGSVRWKEIGFQYAGSGDPTGPALVSDDEEEFLQFRSGEEAEVVSLLRGLRHLADADQAEIDSTLVLALCEGRFPLPG